MRYEARISVYDVMDQVHVHAYVMETTEPQAGRRKPVAAASTTVSGVGESDPYRWLQEALVALAELL